MRDDAPPRCWFDLAARRQALLDQLLMLPVCFLRGDRRGNGQRFAEIALPILSRGASHTASSTTIRAHLPA